MAASRIPWIFALAALGCGRAQAEPPPASSSEEAAPVPPAGAASRQAPPEVVTVAVGDHDLLPCPGRRAFCGDEHPVVARGVIERARAYLEKCVECRERVAVTATLSSMRAITARDDRSRHHREPEDCRSSPDIAILVSPDSLMAGDRPRLVVASDRPPPRALEVTSENGAPVSLSASHPESGEGPPWFRVSVRDGLGRGAYRAVLRSDTGVLACRRFTVSDGRRTRSRGDGVWRSFRGWDGAAENLYSAWISAAFAAPEGKRWRGLGEVLGDRERNFLHDHLGLGEDDDPQKLALGPDCADAPYVLRAYFSWKLGLPFGHHRCRYGEIDGPPRCAEWTTNETPLAGVDRSSTRGIFSGASSARGIFRDFAQGLLEDTTARSLRTSRNDEASDFYPVALRREHLRPGVVYADPWGHTLTLVEWLPQKGERPGRLLAVDAQPDGTIGIRRFWRGNFLFTDERRPDGFGFEAFRPIVRDRGELRLLTNDEIAVADGYGGFSLAASRLRAADFYSEMARMISPRQPSPREELEDLARALLAQLERRVAEVAMAEEIVGARRTPIEMPEGRAIFRAAGPWEAVSTPCRDLRLLVGMDALLAFPAEAARGHPSLGQELEALLAERTASLSIEYTRSDGEKQRLGLAEIIARRARLEMAYNPNDCPEIRWGAAEGSTEIGSCRRRAPEAQRQKMERMRHWFAKRYSCG